MAKLHRGILDGFSGTVGNVVGFVRNGKSYIRASQLSTSSSNTAAQQGVRNKFASATKFVHGVLPFVRVGYKNNSLSCQASSAAVSTIMKTAMYEDGNGYRINYERVMLAHGSLSPAEQASVSISGFRANFRWEVVEPMMDDEGSDWAMVIVYNAAKNRSVMSLTSAFRSDRSSVLQLPNSWQGDRVQVYIAFASADGEYVSDSTYLGEHTVN